MTCSAARRWWCSRCRVRLYTDSTYLRDGITRWLPAWKARGWRTADNQPVKNVDLWQRLELALATHTVEWVWVLGHAGHPENERADQLARRGMEESRDAAALSPNEKGPGKRALRRRPEPE